MTKFMKYFFVALLSISVFSCRDFDDIIDPGDDDGTPPTPSTNIDEGLIAYWNFDDGTAHDVSGNNNHGKIYNHPAIVRGVKGHALKFQGYGENTHRGDYISIPMIDFENMDEFSISMWVNEDRFTYFHGDAYIFFGDWTDGCLTIGDITHYPHDPNVTKTHLYFATGMQLINSKVYGNPAYYPFDESFRNNWVHYCMVYNNGLVHAFINGQLVSKSRQKVKISGDNAVIGGSYWYSGKVFCSRFTGMMDEIRIYDKALDFDEITELYHYTD